MEYISKISEILKNSKKKNSPFTFIYQAYEVDKEEDIKSSIKDFAKESKTGDTFIAFVKINISSVKNV